MYVAVYNDYLGELRPFLAQQARTDTELLIALYEHTGGKIPAKTFMNVVEKVDLVTGIALFNATAHGEILEVYGSCFLLWGAPKTDLAE